MAGNEKASKKLENYGFYRFMVKGEYHHNSPQLSKLLHKAIAGDGDVSQYELFSRSVAERPPTTLRDLLDVQTDRSPIPLEQVEPVENIMRRFCTGGMSLGALSRECHETLAIAMNRIGGKSNSGEGGEDPIRFKPLGDVDDATGLSPRLPHLKGLRNGDIATSAIKQVASGRCVFRLCGGWMGGLRARGDSSVGAYTKQSNNAHTQLRRHPRVPDERQADRDQDGPGRQAR